MDRQRCVGAMMRKYSKAEKRMILARARAKLKQLQHLQRQTKHTTLRSGELLYRTQHNALIRK
jgi:hypothetical protein